MHSPPTMPIRRYRSFETSIVDLAMRARAPLGEDELHPRGRGRDHLLHPVPDPRLPEGHHLLPVRAEPDALLDLRRRLHDRAHTLKRGTDGRADHGVFANWRV